jgi:LmbE family N-acetylglucosaminyl deacetylase
MASPTRTVLALCAHPDDAEFRCGGTLTLLAQRGWKVHVATLTAGDCGSMEERSHQIAARRHAEAAAAAARLGGSYYCLGQLDLQVFDTNETRGLATALLREVRPDCVLTHYPKDYMPDHDAASAIARVSIFNAPMPNYTVGPSAYLPPLPGLVPLYYFATPTGGRDYFGDPVRQRPHFHVDISSVVEQKDQLLACHASQREWLRKQHGVDQYMEMMKQYDAKVGREVGLVAAEAFLCHRGEPYPTTPLIQEALSDLVRLP